MKIQRTLRESFILFSLLCICFVHSSAQFANFITKKGNKLFDGTYQLRFISFNTPNLHYIEDYFPFEGTSPWRLPNEFEIRDAFTSIKQLGGKVTRIYVLSVKRQDDAPGTIRHVENPGQFNEEAFKTLDKVLQIANEEGVRLIIPFVDNWRWWGGPQEYTAFRNKPKQDFWTDPQIIADVKETIKFLITRKNTYTGTFYHDDKAILAWETGNELGAPFSWTKEIASYIKSLDTNHLLMDGTSARMISEDALQDSCIDIVTTHHYGPPQISLNLIVKNQALIHERKPYIVGEFGIVRLQDIHAIIDTIINQGLVGGMIWSLRMHDRDGGFYCHYEYANTEAYRWPGFSNGEIYNERMVLNLMREKVYQIDSILPPRLPLPVNPTLLPINDPAHISWQGSAGAQSYRLERRLDGDTSWILAARSIDDGRVQYHYLFSDDTVIVGKKYFYRIKAQNESGSSDWSNIVGPVEVRSRTLVDEMEDFNKVFQKDGDLRLLTFEDIRQAKEDRSRCTGSDGSYVMYKFPTPVSSVRVEWLRSTSKAGIEIFTSEDLQKFSKLDLKQQDFPFTSNDYGIYDAIVSKADSLPEARYIKIVLKGRVQIGRIEIAYDQGLSK